MENLPVDSDINLVGCAIIVVNIYMLLCALTVIRSLFTLNAIIIINVNKCSLKHSRIRSCDWLLDSL